MKNIKMWLLVGGLLFLALSCTVEERVVEKIVEKNIIGVMESKPYGLSFEIDNKSFFLTDSNPFLDKYFYSKDASYIKEWKKKKVGDYKGPISLIYGRGLLTGATQLYGTEEGTLFLGYDLPSKRWTLQFMAGDGMFQYNNNNNNTGLTINPNSLSIEVYKGDLYITVNEELKLLKIDNYGTNSTAVLSKLFVKSKILNKSEGAKSLSVTIGHGAHHNLFMGEGVSRTQDIIINFHEYTNLDNNLVQSLFYDPDAFTILKKMNKSINYIYINQEKVFGRWDAAGQTLTYKPDVPYPANSPIDIIIPEDLTSLDGNKLVMPFLIRFTTGSSNIGRPDDFTIPFTGEDFNSVSLRWSQADPYNVVSHTIERSDREDSGFIPIATVTPDEYALTHGYFSYQDNTVLPGKNYYYRVFTTGAADQTSDYSKVVEGHALKIVPALLGQTVISNYQFYMTRVTCYRFNVVEGKQYRYEIKDQTNSKDYSALARLDIKYKKADGTFHYYFPPDGSVWQNKTDTIIAPSNEVYFMLINENSIITPGETNNLSFTLTEVVTPAAR